MSVPSNTVPARLYLVEDVVEEFVNRRRQRCPFRIRVWRAKGFTPVVLVSQPKAGGALAPPPSLMSVAVANWVMSAVLRYDPAGMLYYEATRYGSQTLVRQVAFQYFGHAARLRLAEPVRSVVDPEWLPYLVGEEVPL